MRVSLLLETVQDEMELNMRLNCEILEKLLYLEVEVVPKMRLRKSQVLAINLKPYTSTVHV